MLNCKVYSLDRSDRSNCVQTERMCRNVSSDELNSYLHVLAIILNIKNIYLDLSIKLNLCNRLPVGRYKTIKSLPRRGK